MTARSARAVAVAGEVSVCLYLLLIGLVVAGLALSAADVVTLLVLAAVDNLVIAWMALRAKR